MGIIIGDTIELNNGLSVQNAYGCIGTNSIVINKIKDPVYEEVTTTEGVSEGEDPIFTSTITGYTDRFTLEGKARIWINKEKREESNNFLLSKNIIINYTDSSFLESNVYTLLYNKWKEDYTTTTDD
jgi:hypothetical protein